MVFDLILRSCLEGPLKSSFDHITRSRSSGWLADGEDQYFVIGASHQIHPAMTFGVDYIRQDKTKTKVLEPFQKIRLCV